VIDKLELISTKINWRFESMALALGQRAFRYEKWLDLRKLTPGLHAILYFGHQPTGKHKLVLVGVAKLGWTATREIVEQVFPALDDVKIHRIDFCADFYRTSVLSLAENLCLPGTHGFKVYKSHKGSSYYLQSSPARSVLVYDKARSEKRLGKANLDIEITRLEVQLRGKAIPIRDFRKLSRYLEIDVLGRLEVRKITAVFQPERPNLFLAANGFQLIVSKYGLDGALKLFPSPYRAFLKSRFLGPPLQRELSSIRDELRRGTSEWFADRIRFPRLPERSRR
jgi:hypothetical protein